MIAFRLAAIATVAFCAFAADLPQIPQKFQAITLQGIRIIQGDAIELGDTGVLCPYKAPACKVQSAFIAARQFYDASQKATALKNPDGSGVITLYNEKKEYQVTSNGTCVAYCPLPREDSEFEPIQIEKGSYFKGKQFYNGQEVSVYEHDVILIETEDWYVTLDSTGKVATPVADIDLVYFLGLINTTSNMTFVNFEPSLPKDAFTVLNKDTCPVGNNCPKDDDDDGPNPPSPFDDDDGPNRNNNEESPAVIDVNPRRALDAMRRKDGRPKSSLPGHRLGSMVYDVFLKHQLE